MGRRTQDAECVFVFTVGFGIQSLGIRLTGPIRFVFFTGLMGFF